MENRKSTDKLILVVAEHEGGSFHKVSYELLNVAKNIGSRSGMNTAALAVGPAGLPVEELAYHGAEAVYYISDNALEAPEEYVYKANIVPFINELRPSIVLMGATNFGRSLAPRIAAALGTGLTADCTAFDLEDDGSLIQIRPAFSDNIFAHIRTKTLPQMATVRYREFDAAARNTDVLPVIVTLKPYSTEAPFAKILKRYVSSEKDISDAEVVVAAGRGIKRAEDMAMIEELAKVLNASVGVSRALVDAGIGSSENQVGYSGHRVKPKLYIACGISGAPQHIAGMKESETIVAINKDISAPIFSIADIGYVGDIYEVVPELTEYIRKNS